MFAKLENLEKQFEDLEAQLGDPAVLSDQNRYKQLAKSHSDLGDIVRTFREYKRLAGELADNRQMLADPEIREMAQAEIEAIEAQLPLLEEALQLLLLPKDPMDEKNIILEIRAGTGGDEAALFAANLLRMYMRFAERHRWKVELLAASETGIGGYKEVSLNISGERVYSRLKYESGIHRVQRVPETEAQGRIHTSAVTVAVLPEAEEVDVGIDPADLRIDVYRAGGAGGQHVNKTESAVRITHVPTGVVVTCQDERSQQKNKAKAMKVLLARISAARHEEAKKEYDDVRKAQVGTGDRSGRIRTYNFPQGRVTDHRINMTLYNLNAFLDGDLDELIEALVSHYQAEALKAQPAQ